MLASTAKRIDVCYREAVGAATHSDPKFVPFKVPQVPLSRLGLLLHPAGTPHLTCISDPWTVPPLRPPAPCTGNKKTNSPARHSTCSLTFLYHVSSGTETQCVIHGCGGWKKTDGQGRSGAQMPSGQSSNADACPQARCTAHIQHCNSAHTS